MTHAARSLSLAILLIASPALAGTFSWTDERGTVHFTDDASRAADAPSARAIARETAGAQPIRTPSPVAFDAYERREIRIPFERDGHLIRLSVVLNGRIEVPFYLDTGSSGVVLPSAVARRLGMDSRSAPKVVLQTTSGRVQVPVAQLESVQLGSAEVEGLEATISESIEVGLLGGSFFNQFSYQIDPVSKVVILRRISSPNQ